VKWRREPVPGETRLAGVSMKKTVCFRVTALLVVLLATILVCIFSARIYHATYDRNIFEYCQEPISFKRLAALALFGNRSSVNACLNNLRQIDAAKQQWAVEHNKKATDVVTMVDIAPYLGQRGGETSVVSERWRISIGTAG
jgi:hypothetical protein